MFLYLSETLSKVFQSTFLKPVTALLCIPDLSIETLLSRHLFALPAGPTDLSMKSVVPNSSSSTSNSHGQGGGGGGASAQLSPPEVTAVRQLIAGYRESAAFLLRSADELENLILQQN